MKKISIQWFTAYVDEDGWDICDCAACEGFHQPATATPSFGFWEISVSDWRFPKGRVIGQRLTLDEAMIFGQQYLDGPVKADRNAGTWGSQLPASAT
ncbi:hypothetical protein LJR039_005025 [Pseudorhodoferax sp. LjRoot39]|uniref:hypothetical protein n=1 Tax=Pseudorhodoferax sp. LjRoot39 TaxID=3342328 RepID=UPI003ED14FC9